MGSQMITIKINSKTQRLNSGISVTDLLADLHLNTDQVAIELNQFILPHHCFSTTVLKDGDRLELVHFVGGG